MGDEGTVGRIDAGRVGDRSGVHTGHGLWLNIQVVLSGKRSYSRSYIWAEVIDS